MGIYIFNMLMMPLYGKLRKKTGIVVICIQLFLILALRADSLGVDLDNYIGGYEYISQLSFLNMWSRLHLFKIAELVYPYSYESGYVLLNWLCSHIGLSFHSFLVLNAGIIVVSLYSFVKKYSNIPWISFVLFIGLGMFEYSFGILRQTIAVAILMQSAKYIKSQKLIKFLCVVLLAFTFHRVSIIFVPLYFLYKVRVTKNRMITWTFASLILMVISNFIYRSIIEKILLLIGKTRYLKADFKMNNQIILMLAIMVIIIMFIKEKMFDNDVNKLCMWGFMCAIPIEIVGMNNDGFARSVEIFYIFVILLLPNIIYNYGKNCRVDERGKDIYRYDRNIYNTKIIITAVLYLLVFGFMIYQFNASAIAPYIPVWGN